ncbi:hypothetical protein CLI64_11045 [Nostoc sp. CENA543]|uniref:hypothetical protein n=1 Tax=Nostoc sp. CENA543 TaxID=1869241 RepID=UPI000CA219D5|nr:hypothetical protein [Nostoc sp. CENA543]AUT00890.1 hypothetical protein CLI64_11045 [Nostoc sp. CENA543]
MAANTVTITLQANNQAGPVVSSLINQIQGGLGGAFEKAALKSTLMIKGLEAGVAAVTGLIGKLSQGLSQAVDIQSDNISLAGNLMKLTGQNFQQATEFVDQFSERMSKVAAALPGATSDYVTFGKLVVDDIIPAVRELNGTVNPEKLQKELETVSTYGTLLAQQAKVSSEEASRAVSKFLGGQSTLGELSRLDFFEQNVTFRNILISEVNKLGGDIRKLTVQQRLEIFKKAANIPDEVLKAQQQSIAGLTAGFVSNLFDPQTGLFGFMRDLDKQTKGGQSVLSAVQEGLAALIGDRGLFTVLGEVLNALGIEVIDPMLALRSVILGINTRIRNLRDGLYQFLDYIDAGKEAGKKPNIKLLREEFLSSFLNVDGLGKELARITNNITNGLRKLDWGEIGESLGAGVAAILNELISYINAVDYKAINDLTGKIVFAIFKGIGEAVAKLDWGGLVIAGLKSNLYNPINSGMLDIGREAGRGLREIASNTARWWTDLFNDSLTLWGRVATEMTKFFDSIITWFNNLIAKIPGTSQAPLQAQAGVVPNFAGGNPGLLAGLLREQRQAPPGATPVIANSSEAILTQAQQRALLANRGGLTIGNLTIQTAATDAQGIAKDVVKYIAQEFENYAQSRVATVEA